MHPLDWFVLVAAFAFFTLYGLWRGRGSNTVNSYLLAGKTMPWYAMGLSIMATQASAITFISTTGLGYTDGMRFVQFYFGLPFAMVAIAAFAVPAFHRSGVYTAYEFLERRFDSRTRILVSIIFLIQRGLAVGVALYAPAVVLTVIFGWPDRYTTLILGSVVMVYTVLGGIKAVTWSDMQQMLVMMAGLVTALVMAVVLLPGNTSFFDALALAGATGRLNPVVLEFSWTDRYNLFSGLIGGCFLALAYFGTDQSQVQRYLTGKSIGESRLSLLFNGMLKVPMQFLILLTGVVVFVFFTFEKPPVIFDRTAYEQAQKKPGWSAIEQRYDAAYDQRRTAARSYIASHSEEDLLAYRSANKAVEAVRKDAGAEDTNYIFLSFVTRYMPAGVVGLILAAIFAAAMSTVSGEVNSLATVSTIDLYQRYFKRDASDGHYLLASKLFTAFWCGYAILTAQFGASLGSLIEAVNRLGSFFYGGMLGVFVLAFFFPRVGATAAFTAVLVGEAAIFGAAAFTSIFFLWYNVIGALVVIVTGNLLSLAAPRTVPPKPAIS
ncbi:MAG: sodium:solute symporter [Bryobacteraceae bacterium]|nr:sodium:solute symporter [Bryobacteraceae bacterium]